MIRVLLHIILFFGIGFQSFGQTETIKINVRIEQDDPAVNIDVFRCYLSNFEIHYTDGAHYTVDNSYFLVDLEDESSLKFELPRTHTGDVEAISFLIGTDSVVNVSGAFDGDLDPIHGMYWTWNSGYINIKLEGEKLIEDGTLPFEFHIGGYAGDQATARNVTLSDMDLNNEIELYIDLGKFLNMIDLTETTAVMSPGKKAVKLADQFAQCVHE